MIEQIQFNVIGLRTEFPKCLFRNAYIYVDIADRQSYRIIKRKGIRSFRPRRVYRLTLDTRYCLICCELGKRDEQDFLEALDELQRDLLIMGCRDYEQYCGEAFDAIKARMAAAYPGRETG